MRPVIAFVDTLMMFVTTAGLFFYFVAFETVPVSSLTNPDHKIIITISLIYAWVRSSYVLWLFFNNRPIEP